MLRMTTRVTLSLLPSVPFDEDDKDDSVWFLDHDYLENMYGMFKKVNGEWRPSSIQHHRLASGSGSPLWLSRLDSNILPDSFCSKRTDCGLVPYRSKTTQE